MAVALEATAGVVDNSHCTQSQSAKEEMCDTQIEVVVWTPVCAAIVCCAAKHGLCILQNYIYSSPSFTQCPCSAFKLMPLTFWSV